MKPALREPSGTWARKPVGSRGRQPMRGGAGFVLGWVDTEGSTCMAS